ncbi:MAG: YceI family protein [Vulcanimicrobiaceae bacterium]
MRVKSILFAALLTAVTTPLFASNSVAATLERRDIDASRSKAQFSVAHIYVETVTGTVPIVSGSVELAPGSSVPTTVTAVLDPTRIKTGEDDRDGALQAPDWFDTKQFPTWTFASTKVTPAGNNTFTVDGLLTIHGVAVPEKLDVTTSGDAQHPVYNAVGHIDRHAFGMAKSRLDPIVGNDITITLLVQLK